MESGFLVSYATTLRDGVGQWLSKGKYLIFKILCAIDALHVQLLKIKRASQPVKFHLNCRIEVK